MPDNTHFPAIREALAELDVQRSEFGNERDYQAARAIYDAAMKELTGAEQLREALQRMLDNDNDYFPCNCDECDFARAALGATAPAKGAKRAK